MGITIAVGAAILAAVYFLSPPGQTAGASWQVSVGGGASGPAPAMGQPAPDFQVQGLDGKTLRLSDFRGRPVWLNFFATWCPPCRAENPDVEATYKEYQGRGSNLVLLALSLGEDASTVRDYVQRAGLTYTIGLDSNTAVASEYRVAGIPTHVFIDRQGIVRDIRVGSLTRDMMRKELEKIL